jgi:PPOX class probable F420-dependent enzyme
MADSAEPIKIPETHRDLLKRETKAYTVLALTMSDGTPQATPIWFDWDGQHIVMNTARGRVKDRILHKHPKVAAAIWDPQNPERYLQLRGRVVFESEEGGYDQICDLREKYQGDRNFPKRPGEVRVTYKILPESVYAE